MKYSESKKIKQLSLLGFSTDRNFAGGGKRQKVWLRSLRVLTGPRALVSPGWRCLRAPHQHPRDRDQAVRHNPVVALG